MTIPVMKRTGFSSSMLGAIEACASTGAVLVPLPGAGATNLGVRDGAFSA